MLNINNKYIHAKEIYKIKNKPAYAIVNTKSNSEIACVAYYPRWKRYVMFTDAPAVFDTSCLESIILFIEKLNN